MWFSHYEWFHTFIWPAVWAVSGALRKLNCFLEWIIKTPLWLIIHANYTPCLWHWRNVNWFSSAKPQNWFTESMHVHDGVQLIIRKQKYGDVENKSYIFVHNHQAWTISLTAATAIKTDLLCFRPKCQESLINIHWKWNTALEGKIHKTKRQCSHVRQNYSFILIRTVQEK